MVTQKKSGGRKKVKAVEPSLTRTEWWEAAKSSLLDGLDFETKRSVLEYTLQRVLDARQEYCRRAGEPIPAPLSLERRRKLVDAKALRAAASIIERTSQPPSTHTVAGVMRRVRPTPRLLTDRPPIGVTPAELNAIRETVAFLRLLAAELRRKPSDLEQLFRSASKPPKKKLFVWRLAVEWSKVRRQPIRSAPIGSPDTPSPILAFLIAASAAVDDLPMPPGLSGATLRRLAKRLHATAQKYGDDFIFEYVQSFAGKTSR
jgi:hypothetical protein